MASDVKVRKGKNAKEGVFRFSATGRRVKSAIYNFATSLHAGIQLSNASYYPYFYGRRKNYYFTLIKNLEIFKKTY